MIIDNETHLLTKIISVYINLFILQRYSKKMMFVHEKEIKKCLLKINFFVAVSVTA